MKELTILEILGPIKFFFRILKLTPYRGKNKNRVYSKINVMVTFLCGFSCSFLAIFYYVKHKFLPIQFLKMASVRYMIVFRSIAAHLGMLHTLFFLLFNAKKLVQIHLTLSDKIDLNLKKLDLDNELMMAGHQHRRQAFKLVIIIHIFLNIFADFFSSLTKPDRIIFIIITIYPHLACSCINVIFSMYTIIIESRFRMMNTFLQKQNFNNLPNILKCINYIHHNLVATAKNVCSIYSFHLFFWYTVYFILFVFDLHAGAFEIYQKQTGPYYAFLITTWKNCVIYAFDLCYIASRCQKLCLEANRSKSVVVGLEIDYLNEEERNIVGDYELY